MKTKMRLFLTLIWFLLCMQAYGQNIDTTISGRTFKATIKSKNLLQITWGKLKRDVHFSIFQELDTDTNGIHRNRLLKYGHNKIYRLPCNIYVVDTNNVFLILEGANSTINLFGITHKSDSISLYRNTITNDYSPVLIHSPSIVIKKTDRQTFQFTAGHRAEYFEYADTSSVRYFVIDVITSYCCGSFFEEMHFPVIVPRNSKIDIYDDDVSFYEKILKFKTIPNPLQLFLLGGKK